MPCQPRMLEPSKPRPSSNTLSSSLPTGIVKCCEVPSRSVNRRSTALTSFSRHRARTSRGVMGMPEVRGQKSEGSTKKERETHPSPALRLIVFTAQCARLLDEQHLLIRRQRPQVVGNIAFEFIGELAEFGHRGQHLMAIVVGLIG